MKTDKTVIIILGVILFIFVAQIAMIVLKLLEIIKFEWVWVLAVTWMSFVFWFSLAGGVLLLDKLGGVKKDVYKN